MRHIFRSFRSRLLLLVALAIVPPIGLLAANGLERRSADRRDLEASALHLARLAAQAHERRIQGARQLLMALSHADEIRSGAPGRCTRFLRSLIEADPQYSDIGVADRGGRVVCHALANEAPLSVAHRPYFVRALGTGAFAAGEYANGLTSGEPVLSFGYPVRDAAGRAAYVVIAGFRLTALSEALRASGAPADAAITILDRNGRIVARNVEPHRWFGHAVGEKAVAAMARRGELVTEFTGPDGIRRLYGMITIRDDGGEPAFFVAVGLRTDLVFAAANRRLALDLAMVAGLGILLIGGAWGGAEVLVRRPLLRLRAATRRLAGGDLSVRADIGSGVSELAGLNDDFNQMAQRLEYRDVHLRRGQRLEAIGQLAGGVAHDFNNLLTVIIGVGELVKARLDPRSETGADLSQMLEAAQRAAGLTRQLLAFSRRQVMQVRAVRINDIVTQTQAMLSRLIGENVRLVTVLGVDLGAVHADPTQLEQVIVNLAINARDAMPDGGTLTIETDSACVRADAPHVFPADDAQMPPGDYVVLRVSDTGCGMDETTRAQIFEPFFSTKGQNGTGLGLATVYGIVRQSGGYIRCDSEVNAGTCFWIYLPAVHGAVELPAAAPATPPPAGGHERILVVEDETAVRTVLESTLASAGYEVRSTGSASQALSWLREHTPPDLLITDIVMPEMSGLALYEAIHAEHPELTVICISGYAFGERGTSQLPENVHFLQKPFTPAALRTIVRDALDARAARLTIRPERPGEGDDEFVERIPVEGRRVIHGTTGPAPW